MTVLVKFCQRGQSASRTASGALRRSGEGTHRRQMTAAGKRQENAKVTREGAVMGAGARTKKNLSGLQKVVGLRLTRWADWRKRLRTGIQVYSTGAPSAIG